MGAPAGDFAGDTARTVTVDAVTAEAGLRFSPTGYTLTGGTLTLGGAAITNNTITTDASVSTAIATSLEGEDGMTKAGAGTLTLSGDNSGLSGGIAVAAGTLEVASNDALGDNDVSLANGTTFTSDATNRTINNDIIITGNVGRCGWRRLGTYQRGFRRWHTHAHGRHRCARHPVRRLRQRRPDKAGAGSLSLAEDGTLTALGIAAGSMGIEEGVTVTTTGSQLSSSGGTLYIDGTLRNTSTATSTAIEGNIVVGATGTVIQEGNASVTNFLFSGAGTRTWEEGSTFIFRDFTLTPSVSNRTYEMNLVFESTGGTMNVGAISGGGAWTVQGDLTIGENVNFNFGTHSGALAFERDVIVGGTFGAVNGVRSFTLNAGRELLLQNTGTVNIADGHTISVEGSIRTTATSDQEATISGGQISLTPKRSVQFPAAPAMQACDLQPDCFRRHLEKPQAASSPHWRQHLHRVGDVTGHPELAGEDGDAAAGGTSSVSVAAGATLLLSTSNQVNDAITLSEAPSCGRRASASFGDLSLTSASTLAYGGAGRSSCSSVWCCWTTTY